MKDIWVITIYGFMVGMAGTGLGGLVSLFIKIIPIEFKLSIRNYSGIYAIYSNLSPTTRILYIRRSICGDYRNFVGHTSYNIY